MIERQGSEGTCSVALTGGSTPGAFYDWVSAGNGLGEDTLRNVFWTVSDERMVPLENEQSNFGTAERRLLDPCAVAPAQRIPWPVNFDPQSAAAAYEMRWTERFGTSPVYDLCMLGMGDDGHTASLFPDSPIFAIQAPVPFSSVEVPGKGWRLTITPAGLSDCGQIVVMVTGSSKAARLRAVFEEETGRYPIQILSGMADRVIWLVDPPAASEAFPESLNHGSFRVPRKVDPLNKRARER